MAKSFDASMLRTWSAFSDEFIAVWDEKGTELMYFNDSYSKLFGFQDRDAFSEYFSFLCPRENQLDENVSRLMRDNINRHGNWTEEVLLKKGNADVFLARLDIGKFSYDGQDFYLQRIIDIDAQRVFSNNLFKEVKKFEALFQFATLPILLVNKEGNITLSNQQANELFGYSNEEFSCINVEHLIPDQFRSKHEGHRNRYNQHPENRPMGKGLQLSAIKKTGEVFPVEISLGHYKVDEEQFVIAFVIDITKRIESENILRAQKEALEEVNAQIEKLNEELELKVEQRTQELSDALSKERELSDLKSRFVSMASHEFRTPLSTILSSVSLIAKYALTEEQDKRDKHIMRIRSSVNNLTDILNEFLSLGKIEEGKIQQHVSEFNLKEQLQLMINEIQPILKNGQEIVYEHNGGAHVKMDLSLLRNIMINLISNAIKFSSDGASIWADSEMDGSGMLTIRVKDHGLGIPEDDHKHLFERFFRGKNVTNIQGTGLGLHIVSKYIELMGGKIEVESELNTGTTFTLKFTL
ncbi:MAG: ATP-binding protein [Bacteroidota bacterium]